MHDLETERPLIRYRHEGRDEELECDVIAGCDGFHGICRPSIPAGVLSEFSREYPFGWLGILAAVAPVERRARLRAPRARVRAPEPSLAGAQSPLRPVPPRRGPRRVAGRPHLGGAADAPRPRGLDARRGTDPREGRHRDAQLRLRADALRAPLPRGRRRAHRAARPARRGSTSRSTTCACSPRRSCDWYRAGSTTGLDAYSDTCLRRIWRAEHFSWWMTHMLHRPDEPGRVRPEAPALAAPLRHDLPTPPPPRSPRTTSGSRPCRRCYDWSWVHRGDPVTNFTKRAADF